MTWLTAQVAVQVVELSAMRVATSRSTQSLEAMTSEHASLYAGSGALHATGRRWEVVFRVHVVGACTSYSGLMCTHATSYRNRFSSILAYAQ